MTWTAPLPLSAAESVQDAVFVSIVLFVLACIIFSSKSIDEGADSI
jgi:hypothetical protein